MNNLTKQSTSNDELLKLLGISLWVFNSNCGFIIEMIDKEHHNNSSEHWHKLIELTSGSLLDYKNLIITILGKEIYDLFYSLVEDRNCIIHSMPTGEKVDNYVIPIYRNDTKNRYVRIDKSFLISFIKKNEQLSDKIHKHRGY
jgi:hypothetical protein